MKFLIVLCTILAVSLVNPGHLGVPLTYAAPLAYARLVPSAPVGLDGRVVDTPEVAFAKAEHAAAHINERVTLAHEAVKSADVLAFATPGVAAPVVAAQIAHVAAPVAYAKLVPGAPVGLDGRVVDTPEVAVAKAEHAAAHINEKVTLAHEAVKSADFLAVAAPIAPAFAYNKIVY